MQELKPISKENVKKSIIAIGQELIKRASDIVNDLKGEITNFDIKKNYVAVFEEKEEK